MKNLLTKADWADVDYWFTIVLAVALVWMAGQATDRGGLLHLFGATYLIIHAHGRRILAAVKQRDQVDDKP